MIKFEQGLSVSSPEFRRKLNQLGEQSASNAPALGGHVGATVRKTPAGWTINVGGVAGRASGLFPFKIVRSAPDKVRFAFGTVNQEIPEIGAVPLDPVLEDSPELTFSTNGTRIAFLKVTIDEDFTITEISIQESNTLPADTTTEGHIEIGRVIVAGGKISRIIEPQQVRTTLAYAYGGGSTHFFFNGSA